MDLLQLEHFLAVVDERTFTGAARRVYRTQPAVSQSVRKLEAELGVQLLRRTDAGVSPTEAGRLLAGYARQMIDLRAEALHHLSVHVRRTA